MTTSELGRIAAIRGRLASARPDVRITIGDDAAVLEPSDRAQVLSVDTAVEGTHFRRDWISFRELGHRCVIAAVSDLAAMAAQPRAALLSLILPADVDDEMLTELIDGVALAAEEHDVSVVGGNLASGGELSITTTVMGELWSQPLTRSGASEGEGLFVTGDVGSAALGLALLAAGRGEGEPDEVVFVSRWRRPTAQILAARRLQGTATSAIDLSDGLLADLGHLCASSGVGARLHASRLPLLTDFERVARRVGQDPLALALSGGEDYQLLFSAPVSSVAKELATFIGRVTEASEGIVVLDDDERPLEVPRRGWDHFASGS